MNRSKNLDSRFENVLEEYYRDQYGTKSVPARWKKCMDFVNGNLGIAVSALYVRKYFDLESKHKVINVAIVFDTTSKTASCLFIVVHNNQ